MTFTTHTLICLNGYRIKVIQKLLRLTLHTLEMSPYTKVFLFAHLQMLNILNIHDLKVFVSSLYFLYSNLV